MVGSVSAFMSVTSGMRTAPHDPSLFARLANWVSFGSSMTENLHSMLTFCQGDLFTTWIVSLTFGRSSRGSGDVTGAFKSTQTSLVLGDFPSFVLQRSLSGLS